MDVIAEDEGQPAAYPAAPVGLSPDAAALNPDALWQRLESWIAYRWEPRAVLWIVQGPGVWSPRLKPATVDTFEVWDGSTWAPVTLDPAPLGYELAAETYRLTATVGSTDTPPSAVLEAFRRLAEYLADQATLGLVATSRTLNIAGTIQTESTRPAAWQARALHYSGAADLLRGYR